MDASSFFSFSVSDLGIKKMLFQKKTFVVEKLSSFYHGRTF